MVRRVGVGWALVCGEVDRRGRPSQWGEAWRYGFLADLTLALFTGMASAPIRNAGVQATIRLTMPRLVTSSTKEKLTSTAPAPGVTTPQASTAPSPSPDALASPAFNTPPPRDS